MNNRLLNIVSGLTDRTQTGVKISCPRSQTSKRWSRNLSQGLTLGPALNSQKTLLLAFSFFFHPCSFFLCPSGPRDHK